MNENTKINTKTNDSEISDTDEEIYRILRMRLKEKRVERGLTFEELEKRTRIKRSSLQRYESGNTGKVPFDVVIKLEQALNLRPGYLSGWSDNIPSGTTPLKSFKLALISSGIGKSCFSETVDSTTADDFSLDANYCIYMPDDSMADARINEGDLVFIKEQCNIENGEIAAFSTGDEILIRYYYRHIEGHTLCAASRSIPPMNIKNLEEAGIQILGKAVAFQSTLN